MISMRTGLFIVCLSLLGAASARADIIEDFSGGRNVSHWRLTNDPTRLLQVESSGGNPGAYLHGQVFTPVPTWYVPPAASNPFLGNYAGKNVTGFAADLDIFSGVQAPDRAVTLSLLSSFGTGDNTHLIEAYEIGRDISSLPSGWSTYSFSLPSMSETIPQGWVVLHADGTPGTDADWRALMKDVESIGLELGKPGFAYPALNGWDLGLDNVTLRQGASVGESGAGLAFPLVLAGLLLAHRYHCSKERVARR